MSTGAFFIILALVLSAVPSESKRLDDIEKTIGDLVDRNDRLETLVLKLQGELDEERTKNAKTQDDLHAMKDDLTAIVTLNRPSGQLKRQLTSPWVAFSSIIQQTDLTNLHSGQAIVFDHVITNMGANYDPSTGMFTAPLTGVYVFNMDAMVEPSHNEYLEFVKDGSHVMYNYVHAQGGLDDVSSSRTVVLELNSGSRFWVRVAKTTNHGSGTVHGNGFTTFSGWLLRILE